MYIIKRALALRPMVDDLLRVDHQGLLTRRNPPKNECRFQVRTTVLLKVRPSPALALAIYLGLCAKFPRSDFQAH